MLIIIIVIFFIKGKYKIQEENSIINSKNNWILNDT